MTETKAIIALVAGMASLIFAFFCKRFYYAKGVNGVTLGRPAPRWFGRLLFGVIGVVFVVVGINYLVYSN